MRTVEHGRGHLQARVTGAVALILIAATLTGVPVAGAAPKLDPKLARITSPQRDGLGRDGRIRVVVRLAQSATRFHAEVGGRDITRRFVRRRGGRTRVAVLRRGQVKGPRYGANYLYVRTGGSRGRRDIDSVRFVLARRSEAFLRMPARKTAAGRVRLGLRVGRSTSIVRATLNGRRVRLMPGRGRSRAAVLAGDDRLRHGRNRIRVVAFDRRRGVYDVDRAMFAVRRTEPIPGAGAPRRGARGRTLRLDARHSRAARGGRLRYRWKVVRRPRGSNARLRGVTTPRPRLKPDLHGTYRVRLTVTEGPGALGARAAVPGSASDSIPIAVPPSNPSGLAISTRTLSTSGGVTLDGKRLAPTDPTASLQLVALSRGTLELLANESYQGDSTCTAALLKRVEALDSRSLVVLTSPISDSKAPAADPASQRTLGTAVERIGGDAPGSARGFTVIGIPDGYATENAGLRREPSGGPGEMSGYLQLDSTKQNFAYVSADYVPFDTHADATSPTQAVITVGDCSGGPVVPPGVPRPLTAPCTSYASDPLDAPAFSGGFFVLVLDAGTLERREAETFALKAPEGGDFANVVNWQVLESLHGMLARYANDPAALVFVQSIGGVGRYDDHSPTGPLVMAAWNKVADDMNDLGAHSYLFQALPPGNSDSYALVAPGVRNTGGCTRQCISPDVSVASTAASGTPGRLSGVLSRNDSSQYRARGAGQADEVPDPIEQVASQAQVPWPMRDPAHADALSCVTEAIADAGGIDLQTPIERNYWHPDVIDPGTLGIMKTQLAALSHGTLPSGVKSCSTRLVSTGAFNDVKGQLTREFGYVGLIPGFIDDLQKPFVLDQGGSATALSSAINTAAHAINSPPTAVAKADPVRLIADVSNLIGAIPGVNDVTGADLVGSTLTFAADLERTPNGHPQLDLTATESALADEVAARVGQAVEHYDTVGRQLLSDWGRLSLTAANRSADNSWVFSPDTTTLAQQAIDASARRLAYRSLFPLRYAPLILNAAEQPRSFTSAASFTCQYSDPSVDNPYQNPLITYHPFKSTAPGGEVPVVTAAGPRLQRWVYGNKSTGFVTNPSASPTGGAVPPRSLLSAMFSAPAAQGVTIHVFPSRLRFALDVFGGSKINEVIADQTPGLSKIRSTCRVR